MSAADRTVRLSARDLLRLRRCCEALGCTYSEFAKTAMLQALDECEAAGGTESRLRRAFARSPFRGDRDD